MSTKLHSVLPILLVPDVRKTAAAYGETLGFRVCWILGDDPHLYSIVDYAEGEGFHLAYDGGQRGRKNQISTAARASEQHERASDVSHRALDGSRRPLVGDSSPSIAGDSNRSVGGDSSRSVGGDSSRSIGGESSRSIGGYSGRPIDAYIRVGDADLLHAKLAQHGAKILSSPTVRPWRTKEFEVEDVNGFVLCYAADLTATWPKTRITTSPEFAVTDVERTTTFYRDALGFTDCKTIGPPPRYAIVMRDDVAIHFSKAVSPEQVRSNSAVDAFADADVEVSGIDELARELKSRGVKLSRGPETNEFGVRQMEVADPDGYVLCFSEPKGGWGDRSNEGRPPLV